MDKSHSQVDKKSKNDERKTSSLKLNDYENTYWKNEGEGNIKQLKFIAEPISSKEKLDVRI